MKHEVFVLGGQETGARRDGREVRGNEEKERMRKGAIVSSSPQVLQVGAQASKFGFF